MDLLTEFFALVDGFGSAGIPYAVCGGIAVTLLGYPRLTKDVDVLIREEDLERVKTIVGRLGFDLEGGLISFKIGTDYETRLFRLTKIVGRDHLTLDLLLVTPVFESVWATKEWIQNDEGRRLCVVSREGLRTMKLVAGRPQDIADLERLGLLDQPKQES